MEDNTNNKKRMILMLIGLFVSLLAVVGATYAYFSITGTNNSSSSVITNTFGESGNVTLTGSNTLHITLNATDMATNNKGNIYYATDVQSENYKTTSTSYEVAKATVVGGDDSQSYSNCKFNLNVALSGDMANLLQEGDMKITFSGAYTGTYDLSNLSSPYEVTLSNLSGTNRTQSINAVVEFNNLDKDQVYLSGKTLTITLTNTDFSCNGDAGGYSILSGDLDTVGSVVKIANEEFYVIGKEGTKVKMLAKWNLKVGCKNYFYNECENTYGTYCIEEYNSNEAGYGLQSDIDFETLLYDRDNCPYYHYHGTVPFSSTNYWINGSTLKSEYGSSYPAYVYDSNASIKTYVEDYVSYLNQQGVTVTGRLIQQEELAALGCNATTRYCDSNGTHGGTAPSWVYQTSYWSGSAYNTQHLNTISNSSAGFDISFHDHSYGGGVRPVIILEP